MKNKCPGSGQRVSLAWPPETLVVEGMKPYPGGVICPACSLGLEVLHDTVRKEEIPYLDVMDEDKPRTYATYSGVVRAHWAPGMRRKKEQQR